MSSLFNSLFNESFDSISKKDITNGVIAGVPSPYMAEPRDEIGIVLADLEKDNKRLSNQIINLHNKFSLNIKLHSAQNLSAFNELCDRITRAFSLNSFFIDDSTVQKLLAELLAYFYIRVAKSTNYEFMQSDLTKAKMLVSIVFKAAQTNGLTFFSSSELDFLKTMLLTVFYRLPKEKEKKEEPTQPQGAPQAPQQAPPPL